MKRIALALAIAIAGFAGAYAHADDYQDGIDAFTAYHDELVKSVSDPMHLPYLKLQGHKTAQSVLLIHGLFESPHFLTGIANAFAAEGFNVVTILLPGHWRVPMKVLDQTKYTEWEDATEKGLEIARQLGDHVIVAGYSLGGLLAMDAALKNPDLVDGLFMWAPAIEVKFKESLASSVGTLIGANGNKFIKSVPDGITVPYVTPRAGVQIQRLESAITSRTSRTRLAGAGKLIRVPLFLVISDADEATSSDASNEFYSLVSGPKDKIEYTEKDGLGHNSIPKSQADINARFITQYNHQFAAMVEQMDAFIHANF